MRGSNPFHQAIDTAGEIASHRLDRLRRRGDIACQKSKESRDWYDYEPADYRRALDLMDQ